MNIYVGNLPYRTQDEDLRELFAQYGAVLSAKVITDKFSGQSKGFGFVVMENDTEAEQAITALNDHEVSGRKLKVNPARPREDRPQSGGMRHKWSASPQY